MNYYTHDEQFLSHIVCEICNYAVKNEMEPDRTLKIIARDIEDLLEVATFNKWKVKSHD
jgi:hypothetical protein